MTANNAWWAAGLAVALVVGCGDAKDPEGSAASDGQGSVDSGGADAAVAVDAGPCPVDGLACDDGDTCTVGDVCKAGACSPGPNLCDCSEDKDCAEFDDGDLCNGVFYCNKTGPLARCRLAPNSAVSCPAAESTACAENRCDKATGKCGLVSRPDGTGCSDGKECTDNDRCQKGACVGDVAWECEPSCGGDECASKNADKCSGTWFCNKGSKPWACQLNPATAVQCDGSKDTFCSHNACDPATGKCAQKPRNDGQKCQDEQLCTIEETCKGGACTGKDACTCKADLDCAGLDDGNPCNGVLFCDKGAGKCKANPATVVQCEKAPPSNCTVNACDPTSGLCTSKALPVGAPCDDGDHCTGGETCGAAGKCTPATDTCKCTKQSDCVGKDDGDLCNGSVYCDQKTGTCTNNPATIVLCKSGDDTACSKNACDRKNGACKPIAVELAELVGYTSLGKSGWVMLPAGASATAPPTCDDGDPCTAKGSCKAGECAAGPAICACSKDGDCDKLDDGDACNGTLYCDKSHADSSKWACKPNPATFVSCVGNAPPCTALKCVPATGQCQPVPLPTGATCTDDNPCTDGDGCAGGQCIAGNKVCGCQSHADCVAQDDGNLCNGTLFCDKSGGAPATWACKPNPASAVHCPPATKACTKTACNPATGKCATLAEGEGKSCDDGNACTTATKCASGACSGQKLSCNDNNPCTTDGCDPAKGCVSAGSACNDGNACTEDSCDAKTGKCAHTAASSGEPCNADDSGCTVGDACSGTVCKSGPKLTCKDPGIPCQVAVCQGTGAASHKCVAVPSPDGADCDDAAICQGGGKCLTGQCAGGTKAKLYGKLYPNATDDVRLLDVADDGAGGMVVVGGRKLVISGIGFEHWHIARLQPDGEVIWKLQFPKTPEKRHVFASAVIPHGGGFLVAGDQNVGGTVSAVVRMLSTSGAMSWEKSMSVGGTTRPVDIARHPSGAAVVFAQYSYIKQKSAAAVFRLTSSGQVAWQVKHVEQSGILAQGTAMLTDASVVVSGRIATSGSTSEG